jgi:hypothetical protein
MDIAGRYSAQGVKPPHQRECPFLIGHGVARDIELQAIGAGQGIVSGNLCRYADPNRFQFRRCRQRIGP